jgi:hypothetical protein
VSLKKPTAQNPRRGYPKKKDVKLTKRSQYIVQNKGLALKNKPKTNPL